MHRVVVVYLCDDAVAATGGVVMMGWNAKSDGGEMPTQTKGEQVVRQQQCA